MFNQTLIPKHISCIMFTLNGQKTINQYSFIAWNSNYGSLKHMSLYDIENENREN